MTLKFSGLNAAIYMFKSLPLLSLDLDFEPSE